MTQLRPPAAILLAAVAGAVDAVGYRMLDGLFLSFMSGNIARFGMAMQDRFWSTAGLALGLLLLFVGGAAAGTLVGARAGRQRVPLLIGFAALLVAASAWLGTRTGVTGAPALAMAMGVLNTVFPGLGVTYANAALVRIGQAVGGDAEARDALGFDMALVMALAFGVLAAARAFPVWGLSVLWVPAGLLALAGLLHLLPVGRR